MILFTGGFPYAGKSLFVRALISTLEPDIDITKIEPKEFYPTNYDKLAPEKQTALATAAWEVCLVKTEELIKSKANTDLIIFDTAAKSLLHMRPLFVNARACNHHIFYVFVGASNAICKARAGAKWHDKYEKDYADNFAITVPVLHKLSDTFVIIKNSNNCDMSSLRDAVTKIVKTVQDIKAGPWKS